MKIPCVPFLIGCALTSPVTADTSPPMTSPTLALYPQDRKAALSLTFDDGFLVEVNDTLEILDPLGLKGTFFIIPEGIGDGVEVAERFITWERAKQMTADGQEIGTHGFTRTKLQEATDGPLDQLVNGSRQTIIDKIGVLPVSYAAPGGSDANDPRVKAKILEKHDFIRTGTLPYGNRPNRPWSDEAVRAKLLEATKTGTWHTAVIHSIVGGYTPFDSKEAFRAHCEWLKSQDAVLWVAPMGEVGRYIRAREKAALDLMESKSQSLRFRVTSTSGPDEGFDVPLTVVVPIAGAKTASAVAEDGARRPAKLRSDAILVEAPADGSFVDVMWGF
ncbi:MAG: polysaccharide deacetylase family protein [Terrimicrobiaceae bacterium]